MVNYDYPVLKTEKKNGSESFLNIEPTVRLLDFWSWAYSDLVDNTQRGKLAEFIISQAMNCADGISETWGAYDILSPEGIKIEVKTSAYIQSWHQTKLSDINFGIQKTIAWNPNTNTYSSESTRQADIYVFCVQNCKNQDELNPLDIAQWDFYPVATELLNRELGNQKTVGLNKLKSIGAKKCSYNELRSTILFMMECDKK